MGKIGSYPYTSKNGDVFNEAFILVLSAHSAYLRRVCHCLGLFSATFFMALMTFLFVDSANTCPYG